MEIWVVVDGEQSGPFALSEIRRGIEKGSYEASTPAWQRGLPHWTTLSALPSLADAFAPAPPLLPPVLEPATPPAAPAAATRSSIHPVRRFFARWCDLHLYLAIFWLGYWASGRDVASALSSTAALLLLFVPWMLLEAAILHKTGTTPGKWLMGISVNNPDGSRLPVPASLKRSALVLLTGLGMGIPPLSWACQALSLVSALRHRNTLWDRAGNHQVLVAAIRPQRVVLLALLMLSSLQLQMAVTWPTVWQRMKPTMESISPTLAAEMERNPPWHLRPRN